MTEPEAPEEHQEVEETARKLFVRLDTLYPHGLPLHQRPLGCAHRVLRACHPQLFRHISRRCGTAGRLRLLGLSGLVEHEVHSHVYLVVNRLDRTRGALIMSESIGRTIGRMIGPESPRLGGVVEAAAWAAVGLASTSPNTAYGVTVRRDPLVFHDGGLCCEAPNNVPNTSIWLMLARAD